MTPRSHAIRAIIPSVHNNNALSGTTPENKTPFLHVNLRTRESASLSATSTVARYSPLLKEVLNFRSTSLVASDFLLTLQAARNFLTLSNLLIFIPAGLVFITHKLLIIIETEKLSSRGLARL